MPGCRTGCNCYKMFKNKFLRGMKLSDCMLYDVISLTYSLHCRLLHTLGPLLTFFPAALDYSIMLKAGRSCLFSLLYLCTCRYHAVTKYMAVSHCSLCKPVTHAPNQGEPTDDCFWHLLFRCSEHLPICFCERGFNEYV